LKELSMQSLALDTILEGRRSQPDQLVEVLQDIQENYGYIPEEAMRNVSDVLGIPDIEVYRVASFYKAFSLQPRGRNVLTVCMGTACHVRGARLLMNQATGQLGVEPGEMTHDGLFTIEQVNCLGACALGPVVVENGSYLPHMTPGKLRKRIKKLAGAKTEEKADE
jgi:NADH-quinone oxidoreductase subunit E